MIYLTYMGIANFGASAERFATPASRVFEPHPVGITMTKIVLGELLLWDIPTGLLVKSLREPLMLAHHVGMALTAAVGLYPLFSYYALFFYGTVSVVDKAALRGPPVRPSIGLGWPRGSPAHDQALLGRAAGRVV